jgi:CxxC motif-containing protein (DUF1111 family)
VIVLAVLLALAATGDDVGVVAVSRTHEPQPWRTLTDDERRAFDRGEEVFNTQWAPALQPAGQRDGLGPRYNGASCDGCHNSRRRGRGPLDGGDAPGDLEMQLGLRDANGGVTRGTKRFGHVINTLAVDGVEPEGDVAIRYEPRTHAYADDTSIALRAPNYVVTPRDGGGVLDANTVLMPRMPPATLGTGLLERVAERDLVARAEAGAKDGVHGRVSWLGDASHRVVGRFGWQATEPRVASQIAVAAAREMGLSSTREPRIDCGDDVADCNVPSGGEPEIEPALFDALVAFQTLEAVARTPEADATMRTSNGAALFERTGCVACHAPSLPIDGDTGHAHTIHPYTDLLLHDLGPDLADRDVGGRPVASAWRTAPLWGLNLAFATHRPVRLLHDGRARGVDEAIAWHAGEASVARARFDALDANDRATLIAFVSAL